MEAYFHSDPRLEEWVDQITEKIFTVCLLTGVDSEAEFQRGCQIVTKVTHLLQGISIFPTEYLEDGLKQLLEQQLPDSRVISNFPTFQATMNKMLSEGMTRAIEIQNKENLKTLDTSKMNTSEDSEEDAKRNFEVLYDETTGSVNTNNNELERAIPALASINGATPNLGEAEAVLQTLELVEPMVPSKGNSSVRDSSLVPSIPTKPYGIIRKSEVPEHADRLKAVLSNIFPNVSVCWNLNLMGQTFLAQVEDILICLHNPQQPCQEERLNKEGWKVYMCTANDLMFPRRLERGIRQIQRLRKQYKNR